MGKDRNSKMHSRNHRQQTWKTCSLSNKNREILEIKCHLKAQMWQILKIQNPFEKSNVTNFGNQNDNKS